MSVAEVSLRARAQTVLAAFRDRDVEVIAGFIHPLRGVRLSPYAFVDKTHDQLLSAEEFLEAWTGGAPRLWGVEDGTGEPLEMSSAAYFDRFVYDADFTEAREIGFNRTIGRGNTVNNALEAYPGAAFIEYHFPGFEPSFEGMDWKSLRLVFEQLEDDWFLVGIIHDQWTI